MLAVINIILFHIEKRYAYDIASFMLNIPTLVFGFCALGFVLACIMFIFGGDKNFPALLICNNLWAFMWIAVVVATIGWNQFFPIIPIMYTILGITLIIVKPTWFGQKHIWAIAGYISFFLGLYLLSSRIF